MAVQFLNTIDLNNNQLQEFKVDNQTSDPTGLSGEGQLIYRTDQNVLKFHTGSNNWVTLGTSSSTGTVTSVAATHAGNAFTASIGNVSTVNPSVDITMAGDSDEYINGAGNRVLLSTLPQGDVTGITPTDGLTGTALDGPVPTIKVEYTGSDNIVLKASDLNGAGTPALADSIMFSDATDSDVRTATLTQILALAPQGDITGLAEGTYINIDNATGPVPTINHDLTSRTDTSNAASPAFGGTFTAVDSVTTNSTGHLTALNLKTVTLPANPNTDTTYTLPVSAGGANSSVITLDASSGTDTAVTFNGTTNEIALTESTGLNGSITIGLPDDVTITDDLTVGGIITQNQTGETNTFASEVAVPTATASGNAPNLGQVQSLIAGVGIFQGGYNATTGLTTDLSSNGSLDGASNIALDKGDYFVVTVAGGAFYSETLEVGDMIYANQDITASSTPAQTVYTVVIQDANIAGAGSTDGATEKGVAGFNSNVFTVTSNGFVEAKVFNGSQLGVVPNTSSNDATKFLNGQGAFTTPAYVSYSAMNTATLGLGRLRYALGATPAANSQSTTANRTYGVTKNANDQLIVNVPWSDNNTGLTSVGITETGSALTITNTPLTSNGNINIAGAGTASQVMLGNLTLGTYTTGTVTSVATTGPITGGTITGSGTIGISNATLGAVGAARVSAGTGISVGVTNGNFTVTNTQNNSDNTYAETITDTDLTIDHNLGTTDVIVQLYDVTEGVTVYADVDRISANRIGVTFGSTPTNSVRVLVQKIG